MSDKDKEIKEKDKKIEEQAVVIELLKVKTKPSSLGFYRSRFR